LELRTCELSHSVASRIDYLSGSLRSQLDIQELKSTQDKLLRELRGIRYLQKDQMAILLNQSGLSKMEDYSIIDGDVLD